MKVLFAILISYSAMASTEFTCKAKFNLIDLVDTEYKTDFKINIEKDVDDIYTLILESKDSGEDESYSDIETGLTKLIVDKSDTSKKSYFDLALWSLNSGMYKKLNINTESITRVEIYDFPEAIKSREGFFSFYRFFAGEEEILSLHHYGQVVVCDYEVTQKPGPVVHESAKCEELDDEIQYEKCMETVFEKGTIFQKL